MRSIRSIAPFLCLGLIAVCAAPAAAVNNSFTPNLHLVYGGKQCVVFNTQDTEPEVRVSTDKDIFVAAIHGVPGGTDLFQVAPNGLSYIYRGEPDGLIPPGPACLEPGGGDTDLAIGSFAKAKQATNTVCSFTTAGRCQPGPLLITSLNLATVYASQTSDNGKTYTPSPSANGVIPLNDRQWNNAFGGLERYNIVHDLPTQSIDFAKSMDGGLIWVNGTPANSDILPITAQNTDIGPIVVDQNQTRQVGPVLYAVFLSVATALENIQGKPLHTVWVSHSFDDGVNWKSVIAYNGPDTADYHHIFPSMAIDAVGNVYAVWSDDHNVFYTSSTDEGKTWASAKQVTDSSKDGGHLTHIFPWIAAGTNGGIDVVYYETKGANAQIGTNEWEVGMAQNLNSAGTNGLSSSWIYYTPSDHIIHKGAVCEGGTGCTGGRELADDFQIAIDPMGKANITYADTRDKNGGKFGSTQTYFTKQLYGYSLGTPNGDGPNKGCRLYGHTLAGNAQVRVKAPQGASRGWLTVLANQSVAVAGYINSYQSISETSANFSGVSTLGSAFTGSVQNGKVTVMVGSNKIVVAVAGGTYAL